jgi:hypothetical protein
VKPEGGWYAPLAGLLCAALLAASALLFVSMLGTTIGPFRFDTLLEERGADRPLGLWQPASAVGPAQGALRAAWRAVLPGELDVVESADLAALGSAGADPIVVLDARALTPDELDALRAQLDAGRSVVVAGWVAAQGARDRSAMARLLEVTTVASQRSRWLARGARGPLASGLERRLELPAESSVPALPERGELYWTDAEGAPAGAACGALRLVRRGSGSLLWIAALPPASASDPAWRALYRSALASALRRPSHEVLPTPTDPSIRGPELEAWRSARAALRTELDAITRRRVRLRVTNAGQAASPRAIAVRVHLSRPLVRAVAQSSTLFTPAPQLRRAPEHLDLELPAIPAGATRSYVIDVEP